MSKRFGRNQKRRLQRQLAEHQANADRYQAAYEMSDGLQRDTSKKLSDAMSALERVYSDIAKHLNPNHPLLPDWLRPAIKVSHEADSVRLPLSKYQPGFYVKTAEILRRKFVTEQFSNMVAVKVMHGDRVVGYGIDLESLQLMTFREEMVRDLALDIANRLLDAIGSGDNQR